MIPIVGMFKEMNKRTRLYIIYILYRYLVSQLFDVSGQSTIEQMVQNEEITIPWGTGIVGHVAEKGLSVNIPDCYKVS